MKILKLTAHNVMRLTAVEISPDGNTVIISGKNAQGKSSVLNAIWLALDYAAAHKQVKEPLRKGEDEGEIVIDLGEFTVAREFTSNGQSRLKVENRAGARFPSPQAMLTKLLSNLTFDPVAWSMADDAVQLKDLRELVGLDFSDLDAERKQVYDERTAVNRLAKEAEAILSEIPVPSGKTPSPVKIDDLQQKLREADALQQQKNDAQKVVESIERDTEALQEEIDEARDEISELEEKIERLKVKISEDEEGMADLAVQKSQALYVRDQIIIPNREAIIDDIGSANETNRLIEKQKQYAVQRERFEAHANKAADLSKRLQEIDDEKASRLAAAEMPIAGLSFDENQVLFQGVPLSQASQAERILVGLAIEAALNPELRVVCVHDASLLDRDSWNIITKWAEEHDFQVWLETVSNSISDTMGFYIEDGQVKGVNGVPTEEKKS